MLLSTLLLAFVCLFPPDVSGASFSATYQSNYDAWRDVDCGKEYACPAMVAKRFGRTVRVCFKTRTAWFQIQLTPTQIKNATILRSLEPGFEIFMDLNKPNQKDGYTKKPLKLIQRYKFKPIVNIRYFAPEMKKGKELIDPCSSEENDQNTKTFKSLFCNNQLTPRASLVDIKSTCFYAFPKGFNYSSLTKDEMNNMEQSHWSFFRPNLVIGKENGKYKTTLFVYFEAKKYFRIFERGNEGDY